MSTDLTRTTPRSSGRYSTEELRHARGRVPALGVAWIRMYSFPRNKNEASGAIRLGYIDKNAFKTLAVLRA
jgi:hypothetical protein